MTRCYPGCLHRELVCNYRVARQAQLLEEEAATVGDPEMIAERRSNGKRPITLRSGSMGTGDNAKHEHQAMMRHGEGERDAVHRFGHIWHAHSHPINIEDDQYRPRKEDEQRLLKRTRRWLLNH